MPNDLVAFENELKPLAPRFEDVLAGIMPVERLMRTALISVERNPSLLKCDRKSFLNTIMSAAVLGLEMDGVTGQAFPIPFKGKVQLVIGYKGYVTLGARAGLTIDGQVVREGDEFDYDLGTSPFVHHKPKLDNKGKIVSAWAVATAPNRSPVIAVMGIDEINTIKKRSPAGNKSDSPWNDDKIGFPAMASKTVKRRLCRSLPLSVMQLAARMEEAFEEQGNNSFIASDSTVVLSDDADAKITTTNVTPDADILTAPRHIDDGKDYLREQGKDAAKSGLVSLQKWFSGLSIPEKASIKAYLDTDLKQIAVNADTRNEHEIRTELWPIKIEALDSCGSLSDVNDLDKETKAIFSPFKSLANEWTARCEHRRTFFVQMPVSNTHHDQLPQMVAAAIVSHQPAEDFGF